MTKMVLQNEYILFRSSSMSKISPRVESVLITSRNVTAFDQQKHGKVNKLLSNLPPKNMMNKRWLSTSR